MNIIGALSPAPAPLRMDARDGDSLDEGVHELGQLLDSFTPQARAEILEEVLQLDHGGARAGEWLHCGVRRR